MDIQEQLAILRAKVQAIQGRVEAPAGSRPVAFVEELLSGEVKQTAFGQHFETEKLHSIESQYGCVAVQDLFELSPDLLHALSEGGVPCCHPERWAFLDTETTGLAGGSGTYAFLIGIGSIDSQGFRGPPVFSCGIMRKKRRS